MPDPSAIPVLGATGSTTILVAGALLAAGMGASLLATRLRLPGLVLFLALGMAIGSDGLGWIAFDDYDLARELGVIALALILFEGGLSSGVPEIRPVLRASVLLATVGTLLSAAVTGLAAAWLLGLELRDGLLLGAILASTDGAAIFSLLRGSTLQRRLARTLEGEAGMNDPVAIVLVLGLIELTLDPAFGAGDFTLLAVEQLVLGAALGLLVGVAATRTLRRLPLATPGLYPVATLATGALAFGGADAVGGSGFLAVYLAGLALGSVRIPSQQTVVAFHEGVGWVAQIGLFLVLGLLVFPSRLDEVALEGTALALVVVLVARPVSVWVATALDRYSTRERAVLSWAGLRGAVPVVLAIFPVIEGVQGSVGFFNVVFFAVLISTLLQGATFEPFARRLGATTTQPALPGPLAEIGALRSLGAEVVEVPIADGDAAVGRRVRELGLPRDALVSVIERERQAIPPRGSTRIEAGDRLHLLVRRDVADRVQALVRLWREGPLGRPEARPAVVQRLVFAAGPWDGEPGSAAHPSHVRGVRVTNELRTRHDRPGALVALADGRFAVTGPTWAIGPRASVQRFARQRLEYAGQEDAERSWWQEVAGALAR